MQKFDRQLEKNIAQGVAGLRERFLGSHIEWDLDAHDRFVIADIMFGPEATRAEWLQALSDLLDRHSIAAVAALEGARPEVIDAFTAAGYDFDVEGNAVRSGLALRSEAMDSEVAAGIRELDRRYRDVLFEWRFARDGGVVLEHVECGRADPDQRVSDYLEGVALLLSDVGSELQIVEDAQTEWLSARLGDAGFYARPEGSWNFAPAYRTPIV
jgi:hypothetical protein